MTEPALPNYRFETKSLAQPERYSQEKASIFNDFLKKWFAANDSIVPEFIPRQEWKSDGEAFHLEGLPDGKQKLKLPDDLQLWEIGQVISIIDNDTFSQKPEKKNELILARQELNALLADSAVLIARHLDDIKDKSGQPDQVARGIAKALAEELYVYGSSMQLGNEVQEEPAEQLAQYTLSPEREEELLRWLAGNELYEARRHLAEKRGVPLDQVTARSIAQFFGVAKKAFELREGPQAEELRSTRRTKVWESEKTVHDAFIQKVRALVRKQVQLPKEELVEAVSRRGLEKLLSEIEAPGGRNGWTNVLESLGLPITFEKQKLYNNLNVPKLKQELVEVRQSNDVSKIAKKERSIALKIQREVSKFQYEEAMHEPSRIVDEVAMNCVGYTAVAGSLMREMGLAYLVVTSEDHSVLLQVSSDNRVFWNDMQKVSDNTEITDEILDGENATGNVLTTDDIAEAAKNSNVSSLRFTLDSPRIARSLKAKGPPEILCFPPEIGERVQLLANMAIDERKQGHFLLQQEIMKHILAMTPGLLPYEFSLAQAYINSQNYVEAIELCQEILRKHPEDADAFILLAYGCQKFGMESQARDALKKAQEFPIKEDWSYYTLGLVQSKLGMNEDAIASFENYLRHSDNPESSNFVKSIRERIAKLKSKIPS